MVDSSSELRPTPTSIYIKHSRTLPNVSSSTVYRGRSTQYQKHGSGGNDLFSVYVLLSVLLVLVTLVVAALVFLLVRKIRKKSIGYQGQGAHPEIPLQEFPENVAERLLQSNDIELRGDSEQPIQPADGGERPSSQTNGDEERQQPTQAEEPLQHDRSAEVMEHRYHYVESGHSPEQCGGEGCLYDTNDAQILSHEPSDGEENSGKRPPFEGTALSLRIGGYVSVYKFCCLFISYHRTDILSCGLRGHIVLFHDPHLRNTLCVTKYVNICVFNHPSTCPILRKLMIADCLLLVILHKLQHKM